MIQLITFADDRMSKAAEICIKSGMQNNVGTYKLYEPSDIIGDKKFYQKNKPIITADRGPMYWLWKPYIINKALGQLQEGDHLIYADAGVEILNNIRYIIDRMDQDIFLFGNKYPHQHWCKMDIMEQIGHNPQGNQAQASVIVIKNTEKARAFVAEWLKWCQAPGLIDDSPSKTPNHPEFQENRHDQAILTTLAYRDGIQLHWWAAQYNCGAFQYERTGHNDQYPILFHHHRRRDAEWDKADELSMRFKHYFKTKYGV
jgi:hypothetical protein